MDITTRGPVSAAAIVWRHGPGWVLTVICKTVFDLTPGKARLRHEPAPPAEHDVPWDPPYNRTLHMAGDIVPFKPRVDVTLSGHAYAPEGRALRSFVARLAVRSIDKAIEVTADRYYDANGTLREGAPITHMPLVYELAAGGPGTWNLPGLPVGQYDRQGNLPLPNLLPEGTEVSAEGLLAIQPAGFSPLPPDAPSRVEKLGRRSLRELPAKWNGQTVPDDFPMEYFNAAPDDQQLAGFRGDETLTLEHLHPSHAILTVELPGLAPTVIHDLGGQLSPMDLSVDTLHIDTDRTIGILIWRGHLAVEDSRATGRLTVSVDPSAEITRNLPLEGIAAAPEPEERLTRVAFERRSEPPVRPTLVLSDGILPPEEGQSFADTPDPDSALDLSWGDRSQMAPALPFKSASGPDPLSQSSAWTGTGAVRAVPPPLPSQPLPRSAAVPPPLPSSTRAVPPPLPSQPQSRSVAVPPPPQAASSGWGQPSEAPVETLAPPPLERETALPQMHIPRMSPLPDFNAQAAPPAIAPAAAPPAMAPVIPLVTPPPATAPSTIAARAVAAVAAAPPGDSPWAGGQSGGPVRETIGMAAASGALALADPSYERLKDVDAGRSESRARSPLQLLWCDAECVARVRRVPEWSQILEDMERKPLDQDLEHADGAREPWEIEDRRELFEVLLRGTASPPRAVEEALGGAKSKTGKFTPPLAILEGELELQTDELESLKATASAAAAIMGPTDEAMRAAVESADAFLKRPGLSVTPAVCEGLSARIRDAFNRERKALPADHLDKQTERALLSGRHYQKRLVLGATYLRALLRVANEKEGFVTYLAEELEKKLPMHRRFQVRLLVDIHPQQDPYEGRSSAVRALAVGRLI